MFHCKRCTSKGNFYQLQQLITGKSGTWANPGNYVKPVTKQPKQNIINVDTIQLHKDLKSSNEAFLYLRERGLYDEEAIEHFDIGYDANQRAITFPSFDRDGKLTTVKYRYINEKSKLRYRVIGGGCNPLINLPSIDQTKPVVICEGETDTLTVWIAGYLNVVGLPGASMAPQIKKYLPNATILIVATDDDDAGNEAAKVIFNQFPNKCRRLLFDGLKDANEFYLEHGAEELLEKIENILNPTKPFD